MVVNKGFNEKYVVAEAQAENQCVWYYLDMLLCIQGQ